LHPSTATWEAVDLVLTVATLLAQIYDIGSLRENDEKVTKKRKRAGGGTPFAGFKMSYRRLKATMRFMCI